LSQNVDGFCRKYGDSAAFLTISFPFDLHPREASRKFANFNRRFLRVHFGEWVKVQHFTKRGRVHFHLVIDCRGDITTGFNWGHYKQVQTWNREGRNRAKPRGNLNKTEHLRRLHVLLARKVDSYGLGRPELAPIRCVKAAGRYVGGYMGRGLEFRPPEAKGTRTVNYSRRFPRSCGRQWSWANAAGWLWRAKLGVWASKHGCRDLRELTGLFGPRWAYHHREQILGIVLRFYPTWEHAKRDGRDVRDIPSDATNLEFVSTLHSPPGNACVGVGGESNAGGIAATAPRRYLLRSPKTELRGGGAVSSAAPQIAPRPPKPLLPLRRFVLPGKRVVRAAPILAGAERLWASSEKLFPCPAAIAVVYGVPD
jgi:hypothetical protein